MFQLVYKTSAVKELNTISDPVNTQIRTAILNLSGNPRPFGYRKIIGDECLWRIRVGDYRVVYEIHDSLKLIRIIRIRHRKDAYR